MSIKPGGLDDFANSMAAAIEKELNDQMVLDGLPPLVMDSSKDVRDRRRLFVAIARGVVGYLKANESSIVVNYDDSGAPKATSASLQVTGI
jgi:hypothetical protein